MLLNGHFQLEKTVLADWAKTKKVSARSGMRISVVAIRALDLNLLKLKTWSDKRLYHPQE